ncbi:MAG: GDSL family lipase [Chloroflexi bacterium]|nr:GDSL family lipase [Chloroflexota bacterium]
MPNHIKADDPRITWQGVISLERGDDWVMPWRIPHELRGLFPPDALRERAAMPAGVRISFMSDTTSLTGHVKPDPEYVQSIDVYCDGKLSSSISLAGKESFHVDGLPAKEKLIELWLPQYGELRIRSLEIDDGASIAPFDDSRPKWVTYGSSITQCRAAESPSMTWPAIVAREGGFDLTCLGYGGQCHLDTMMARMIRDIPADFLSMKVGINMQDAGSLGIRTFRSAIIGSVQIIREKHPDTPFAVISSICSPPRENTPNVLGLSLRDMRDEVADAVETLKAHGDGNIYYVDGLNLLGPEHTHLLPDELHPNAEGYKILAQNFLKEVAGPIFRKQSIVQS